MNAYAFLIGWVTAGLLLNINDIISVSFLVSCFIGLSIAFVIQSIKYHTK